MIRFDNLSVGYKEILVKINDLQLDAGKVYAIVGQNGKGKTTLLKTINGLLKPIEGSIFIGDTSISTLRQSELAKQIAFVSSRFEGLDHLTVFNYVALGRTPYLGILGHLSEKDQSSIKAILNKLNIAHLAQKQTSQISDGQRQLTSIARALAQETPVITLDEPTAFLDYINKVRFIRQLADVAESEMKCVVISTHDIDLCLEEKVTILYIDKERKLNNFNGSGKQELLEKAFDQIS
jgi:iron complex transport system ATP-binding protein